MFAKEKTSFDRIVKMLEENGKGNHDDNLKVLKAHCNYSQAKLTQEEFLNLIFLSSSSVRKIVPIGGDRNLKAVAYKAIKLLKSGDTKLDSNWKLDSLMNKFNEEYSNSDEINLNFLLLREAKNGEKKHGNWYLQDGNHRALAYAIKILQEEIKYHPQKTFLVSK